MPPRVAFVTIGPSPCTDVLPVIIAETRTCFAPIGFVPTAALPPPRLCPSGFAATEQRAPQHGSWCRNGSHGWAAPGRQARRSNADGRAGFAPFCNAPSV